MTPEDEADTFEHHGSRFRVGTEIKVALALAVVAAAVHWVHLRTMWPSIAPAIEKSIFEKGARTWAALLVLRAALAPRGPFSRSAARLAILAGSALAVGAASNTVWALQWLVEVLRSHTDLPGSMFYFVAVMVLPEGLVLLAGLALATRGTWRTARGTGPLGRKPPVRALVAGAVLAGLCALAFASAPRSPRPTDRPLDVEWELAETTAALMLALLGPPVGSLAQGAWQRPALGLGLLSLGLYSAMTLWVVFAARGLRDPMTTLAREPLLVGIFVGAASAALTMAWRAHRERLREDDE